MNFDNKFTVMLAAVKKQKQEAAQSAMEAGIRAKQEKANQHRARKEVIVNLLATAQKNMDTLMRCVRGNQMFPNYLKTLFEKRAHSYSEHGFITTNFRLPQLPQKDDPPFTQVATMRERDIAYLVLPVESTEEPNASRAIDIVLRTGEKGTFERRIDSQRRRVEVLVMHYHHDHRTGTTSWSACDLYWNADLDRALYALAKPDSAVRWLLEKFGTPDEWPPNK